jgi:hypothetical protein
MAQGFKHREETRFDKAELDSLRTSFTAFSTVENSV